MHPRRDLVQHRAAVFDRRLHHIRHHRVKRLVHRHTPGASCGQRALAVARLVHRQLQRAAVARVLGAEVFHPVGDRVLAGGAGDLVDQCFHHVAGVGGPHAAPPQHRHIHLGVVHRQLHGQVVRGFHAFDRGVVHAVLDHEGLEWRASGDRLADDDMVPGQHLALGVKPDLGAVYVHRAVVATLDVVLPAPERAHRGTQPGGAGCLGHPAGLHHVVAGRNGAAAKTAPGHLHVHLDVLRGHAQHGGCGQGVDAGHLGAQPQLGLGVSALPAQLHGAVQRLHGGVGQVGEDKLGADFFRRGGQRGHVGLVLQRACFLRQLTVAGQLLGAVHLLDSAGVPVHLQRVTALFGGPVAVGQHGHTFTAPVQRHAQHGFNARHGTGGCVVQRGHLAAKHRRVRDHGRQHAGQPGVNAIRLLAGGLVAPVQPTGGLTNDAEIFRAFQRDRLGHRQLHGRVSQHAVAQLFATGADDKAFFSAQAAGADTPLLGSG